MLRDRVSENARRLDEIDRLGTRGVAILGVQVQELSKDLGGVQHQLELHQREHEQDARDRRTSRRWAIGIGCALFAAIESPLVTLLISHH